jgi:hypothetical protein
VPDERDEAIRDLSRAREDAIAARLRARQQLRECLIFCVSEPYFSQEAEYGDQERDIGRAAEG